MENASNALIMAAGVLIGILMLSLISYLIIDFGSSSANIHKRIEDQQLEEFNTQFTAYETDEQKWTVYDVLTVAALARENNKYYIDIDRSEVNSGSYDIPDEYRIDVFITGESQSLSNVRYTSGYTDKSDEEFSILKRSLAQADTLLIGSDGKLPRYSCTIIGYHDFTGRIAGLRFER